MTEHLSTFIRDVRQRASDLQRRYKLSSAAATQEAFETESQAATTDQPLPAASSRRVEEVEARKLIAEWRQVATIAEQRQGTFDVEVMTYRQCADELEVALTVPCREGQQEKEVLREGEPDWDQIYCPACGSCGIMDCCPAPKCIHRDSNQKQYDEIARECDELFDRAERAEAELAALLKNQQSTEKA